MSFTKRVVPAVATIDRNPGRRGGLTAAALGVLLFVLVALTSNTLTSAAAVSPHPSEKAGIVFSNGGRIVSIKADGSDRKVLTRKKALDGGPIKTGTPLGALPVAGDLRPRMSPGGTRMLFNRATEFDLSDGLAVSPSWTMIAGPEGEKPRRVLRGNSRVRFTEANWMPDGTHLVAARSVTKRNSTINSIVITKPDGKVSRTVLRLRPYVEKFGPRGMPPKMIATELAVSPGGSRVLATIRDGWLSSGFGRLEVITVATGKRKVIAKQARSGSWSPDGKRVVYVTNKDGNGKSCWNTPEEGCRDAGELYTVDADGFGPTRLTYTLADETSPSWSPDGQRIAFASTRIRPRKSYSNEIYSITPDGKCLTWLTNGSPASEWPSWTGKESDSADPGGCGAVERAALVEGKPSFADVAMSRPRLWLGPEFEGRLYNGFFDLVFMAFSGYEDCGLFRGADCPDKMSTLSAPVCFAGSDYAELMTETRGYRVTRERGATVFTGRSKGKMERAVFTGGTVFTVLPGEFFGNANRDLTPAEQNRALKALRLATSDRPGGKLPPMRIPRPSLRKMRKVNRVVKRTGSVRKAAVRLGMKRKAVREQVRGLRIARKLGPLRPLNCNRKLLNDPWGMDSRASGDPSASVASRATQLGAGQVTGQVAVLPPGTPGIMRKLLGG